MKRLIKAGKNFATLNLTPGFKVYGEKLVKIDGREYRIWDPRRSKMGAALRRGLKLPDLTGMTVLYLGVASGTTASHISDLIGPEGALFGVDIAPRPLREFVLLCRHRRNMVPILADASKPKSYSFIVPQVDFLYQDVAQPNQAQILLKNAELFLKPQGYAFVAVKARSIDVTAAPEKIFRNFEKEIARSFEVIWKKRLEPFEKDHMAFFLRKK